MDIAAASMALSSSSLQLNASISVTKKAMDQQEIVAAGLLEMIPSDPNLGQNIDVQA